MRLWNRLGVISLLALLPFTALVALVLQHTIFARFAIPVVFGLFAWWASIVVVALYFLTGLVHSRATDITRLIRFNQREIKTEVATAELQIEDLIRGIATGDYVRKVGSQFGSIWGFDGLIVQEATPEEYAAFDAVRKVKICHGRLVSWLGKEW